MFVFVVFLDHLRLYFKHVHTPVYNKEEGALRQIIVFGAPTDNQRPTHPRRRTPPLSMMGLTHSKRSPLGMRIPQDLSQTTRWQRARLDRWRRCGCTGERSSAAPKRDPKDHHLEPPRSGFLLPCKQQGPKKLLSSSSPAKVYMRCRAVGALYETNRNAVLSSICSKFIQILSAWDDDHKGRR